MRKGFTLDLNEEGDTTLTFISIVVSQAVTCYVSILVNFFCLSVHDLIEIYSKLHLLENVQILSIKLISLHYV